MMDPRIDAAIHHPRLFPDLRRALHVLYSLNGGTTAASHDQQQAAHEFLMQLQARNVKRKLLSLKQSQNDQLHQLQRRNRASQQLAEEILGSSWLACIKVLSTAESHPSERLFAAQTLMHRMRRAKVSEAIDWEVEAESFEQAAAQPIDWHRTLRQYCQLLEPSTAEMIAQFLLSESGLALVQDGDEERIKSEVTLLTVASLSCTSVYMDRGPDLPLLSTLGSTMAAIALRLRYTPKSIAVNGGPVPSTVSIASMILHSLSTVREQVLARMQPSQQGSSYAENYFVCVCSCLAAIPDTILGSPGGARGRLSVDPRCVVAAADELRKSGMHEAWEALGRQQPTLGDDGTMIISSAAVALLAMCERWARYLPIPKEVVQHSLPIAKRCLVASMTSSEATNPTAVHVAFTYVIALLEGGAWTEAQILSFNLGLSIDQQPLQQQATKRKPTSKSKQRKRDMLRNKSTGSRQEEAAAEYRHRGQVAWETSHFLWDVLQATIQAALERGGQADGEGPIGVLCACANSCLPYILRCSSDDNNTAAFSQELVKGIMSMFQAACSSPERSVRGLTFEPLLTLHSILISIRKSDDSFPVTPFQSLIMDHFFSCCMNLASSCAYAKGYFDDMSKDNDEELEVERNDVRDVLRTLCGMGEINYVTPSIVTVQVLDRVVHSCCEAVTNNTDAVPPEPVVHAFSALAKPFNHLAFAFVRNELPPELTVETLRRGVYFLQVVSKKLVAVLEQPPISAKDVFATCRLSQMAVASFAPAFHAIACKAEGGYKETPIHDEMKAMLQVSLKSALLSVVHIPELYAESTLDHTQYDIIGAMRGPGGEDHVGILVFMRMADEADGMARLMADVGSGSSSSLLIELCELHDHLKAEENKRPPGVMHGTGVTTKSRRILLGTISKVVNLTINTGSRDGGTDSARHVLESLFFGIISSLASTKDLPMTAQLMYQVCEATFDLASFGPDIVSELFRSATDTDSGSIRKDCILALTRAGCFGYETFTFTQGETTTDTLLFQWGRLRASQLSLVKSMNSVALSGFGGDFVRHLMDAECGAIVRQCQVGGPASNSSIFNDDIISENIVGAGAVLFGISESLLKADGPKFPACHVELLAAVSQPVLRTISDPCGQATGFLDPRPNTAEAWYLALSSVLSVLQRKEADGETIEKASHLVGETCSATVVLLLSRSLAKDATKRAEQDKGMAVDGPQVLAMLDFLEGCFCDKQTAERIGKMVVPLVFPTSDGGDGAKGLAIVASSLLRGCSGVLPPWAVEYVPNVFSGIFKCIGEDASWFCQLLDLAMNLRFSDGDATPDGELLLAGKVIATLPNHHKSTFLRDTMDAVSKGSWKRFKVLLKQVCGGKKKASGFSLKPSPTRWEGDRI